MSVKVAGSLSLSLVRLKKEARI